MAVYRIHEAGVWSTQSLQSGLEKNVQEYLRVGKYLKLSGRISYRRGLFNQSYGLLHTYLANAEYLMAFRTAVLAFKSAPSWKMKTSVPRVIVEFLKKRVQEQGRILRIEGLGLLKQCCGERTYDHIKRCYRLLRR
jgi:hypothetical protein